MSSVTGDKIRLSVFGESHGEAIGCVIDGLPHGLRLDRQLILRDMGRRAPGRDKTATPRAEKDAPQIISGMLDGVTTGAPLTMIIKNENIKSGDYSNLAAVPRPSHSDYPAYVKYNGDNDVRGGGHFSGRLTAPLVFAGAVAKQYLAGMGITVGAHILQIGSVIDTPFDMNNISKNMLESLQNDTFAVISATAEDKMRAVIEKARLSQDSVGGIIECAAAGVPAGAGGNMFDTVESRLCAMLFGIPAVKGVEFGLGFKFAESNASCVNDEYCIKNGKAALLSNNNGGVIGGITSGAPIVFRAAFKPTPSISRPQRSINIKTMTEQTLVINGRHDPCIVPRAVPVVEAAAAFILLDMLI